MQLRREASSSLDRISVTQSEIAPLQDNRPSNYRTYTTNPEERQSRRDVSDGKAT
jgi:hypothetical protein